MVGLQSRESGNLRDCEDHWSMDSIEPCVHSGAVYDGDTHPGHVLVIVHVDDILLASSTEEAEAFVVDTISKVVPTKTTGQIPLEGGVAHMWLKEISCCCRSTRHTWTPPSKSTALKKGVRQLPMLQVI